MFRHIDVEEVDDGVIVVEMRDRKILDETNILALGDELFSLVDEHGHRRVVLDFHRVEYMSSAAFGKLITFDKKMRRAEGRYAMCGVIPSIYEVFAITRSNKIFRILPSREDALSWLSGERAGKTLTIRTRCPVSGCGEHAESTHSDDHRDTMMSMSWSETCPGCGATFLLEGRWPSLGGTTEAFVRRVTAATYEGESVTLTPNRSHYGPPTVGYGLIAVAGRLDLFAAEAVERLWRSLPAPRWAALDLRKATELSPRGIGHLAEVHASDPPNFPAAIVAKEDAASLIPACFPRVDDLNALGRALAPPPSKMQGSHQLKTTVERGRP